MQWACCHTVKPAQCALLVWKGHRIICKVAYECCGALEYDALRADLVVFHVLKHLNRHNSVKALLGVKMHHICSDDLLQHHISMSHCENAGTWQAGMKTVKQGRYCLP